jgi:hypothetical protein
MHVGKIDHTVAVLVEAPLSVERHDRPPAPHAVEQRTQRSTRRLVVNQRMASVKLDGDVLLGQGWACRARQIAQRTVPRVVEHALQRFGAKPELPQQPEHRRRMHDAGVRQIQVRTHTRQHLLVEATSVELFLIAGGTPSRMSISQLLGSEEIEQLDIVRRHVVVPRADAAA